jgi:hypothetical protein
MRPNQFRNIQADRTSFEIFIPKFAWPSRVIQRRDPLNRRMPADELAALGIGL